MRESPEPRSGLGAQTLERRVGGRADRDVVGMSEDAVGAERHDDSGLLLRKNPLDRTDDVLEGNVGNPAVRQTEPLVPIGHATERAPRGFVLSPPDGAEGLSRGRESIPDVPLLTRRRVHEDETEVRFVGMQRDAAGGSVGVVVRVREDAGERAVGRHRPSVGERICHPPVPAF